MLTAPSAVILRVWVYLSVLAGFVFTRAGKLFTCVSWVALSKATSGHADFWSPYCGIRLAAEVTLLTRHRLIEGGHNNVNAPYSKSHHKTACSLSTEDD